MAPINLLTISVTSLRWRTIDNFLIDYAARHAPVTARQLFYACTVAGLVEKTEICYSKIQFRAVKLRRDGLLDWGHVVDGTRRPQEPLMYDSVAEAVEARLTYVRLNPWSNNDVQLRCKSG
jgi:hypothetical protein